jgi:broad specificity phosphatase PhoE
VARLFLVRHGQTAWNLEGRVQGHTDIPLNELGRSQIKRLSVKLESVSFALAFSSDLSRCSEAARTLLGERDAPLSVLPELREQDYGEWEGLTYKQIEDRYPSLFDRLMTGDSTFAPPNGESVDDMVRRVGGVREKLSRAADDADEAGGDVLVVGHSGSLRALIVALLDLPAGSFWRFQLDQTGLSVVSLYPENATLDLWNDISHLRDADVP